MTNPPEASHLAGMIALFDAAGYERVEEEDVQFNPKRVYRVERYDIPQPLAGNSLGEHEGTKIGWELDLPQGVGYHGFIVVFYFTETGALITHGCWD